MQIIIPDELADSAYTENMIGENDRDFAEKLLMEKHILVIPGSGFSCADDEHFRIVMLPQENELRNAIRSIGEFLRKS